MDENATAMLTPDEIVIKLVEKEATIKCEKGPGEESLLFAKGNAKRTATSNGTKSGNGDECDED